MNLPASSDLNIQVSLLDLFVTNTKNTVSILYACFNRDEGLQDTSFKADFVQEPAILAISYECTKKAGLTGYFFLY